jgi:hypothetical protein
MHKLVNLGLAVILLYTPALLLAQQPTIEQLEQRCEEMRENRIKPLREAEIEKCKADKTKDPARCERYYKDYGNATRGPEGKYTPRMFDDLAPCVQAREMKAKTREGSLPASKRSETTTDLNKTVKDLTTTPAEPAATTGKTQQDTSARKSTLETKKRDTEKTESSRDTTLPTKSRDSSSGTSTR